jgi:hypothetical protein
MDELYIILIFVVFIIILVIAYSYNRVITGGSELSSDIINVLDPYILETKKVKGVQNLCTYLEKYYEIVPNKKKDENYLKKLISKIVYDNKINSVNEFISKSNINYGCFLNEPKKCFIYEIYKYYKPSDEDIKKIASLSSITNIEEFLKYNKFYKLKSTYVNKPVSKIRTEARKNPEKVFEIDYISLMPKFEVQDIEKVNNYLINLKILDNKIHEVNNLENRLRSLEAETRQKEARERSAIIEQNKEAELEEEFYRRLQEDPELEETAKSLGMSLHDLFEQYKLEKDIIGSGESDPMEKIRQYLELKLADNII